MSTGRISARGSSLQLQTNNGSRPWSQYSGSDYSQPQSPDESQSSLSFPEDKTSSRSGTYEDVSLNSRPASKNAGLGLQSDTSSQSQEGLDLGSHHFSTASSQSVPYSEGSGYQSRRSSSTKTMAVSPRTPQDAHMSIHSLQSLVLAESDYDYAQTPTEQAPTFLGESQEIENKHSRRQNSFEMLENVWSPEWSETEVRRESGERPPPPKRQSTLFDVSKDLPLTPTADSNEFQPSEQEMETSDITQEHEQRVHESAHQHSGSTLTVDGDSAIWSTEGWRPTHSRRISSLNAPTRISDPSSEEDTVLDWNTLDKTEEQEKQDKDLQGAEDESTQFLLARLEQENAKFSADPKSSANAVGGQGKSRPRRQTRPPSMAHIKKLVSEHDAPSIRYSLVSDTRESDSEEPPPMTELEFWTALVQDYPFTASRLPTLTTTKIRAGIPPPLRGVVWTSMSGARDAALEEAFDKLKNEESAYEGIINKDLGRSFPGVEMFRDADGEGQKMLGRVLNCFSLYDKDIGYCQGLGFLVGPLLMNMGEKEAFCVLVRLMEHYALRPSFLPTLSGLHLRIFQFSIILNQTVPHLADHLGGLGIEPAYLSQWFLSCFATTCPLELLFRIYDVIFAEGANETVMRVALSLFLRNEEKMMAMEEFEDIMELLLGRSIWDVYGFNGDELVDDFTSLGNIVTHSRLAELEAEYETGSSEAVGQSAGFLPDVQAAASNFLGRLWAPNQGQTPSKISDATVTPSATPQSAEKGSSAGSYLSMPRSLLRRIPSSQRLPTAADNTPSDGSASSGSASITSTAPTETEGHEATGAEYESTKSKAESIITMPGSIMSGHAQHMSTTSGAKEQLLQTEIEDLLMALSEMQREHAQLTAMLQKEREERSDDHRVVGNLLSKLTNGEAGRKTAKRRSMPQPSRPASQELECTPTASDKRKTLPPRPRLTIITEAQPVETRGVVVEPSRKEEIDGLVNEVQCRLESNARFSATFETKAQLRGALSRAREQLASTEAQVKDLGERLESSEASVAAFQEDNESLRAEADELRQRANQNFKEKQKLELTIENMQIQMRMEAKALEKKQRNASLARADSSGDVPTAIKLESPGRSRNGSLSSNPNNASGLRDLKLGRRDSMGSTASVKSMKSQRQNDDEWPTISRPTSEDILTSPPKSPSIEVTPMTPTAPPQTPLPTSLAVPPPSTSTFSRRTTSLATKEVFATPQHETVPDEALLLELVNAKTAEATARAEIDELRKALQLAKRRADENFLELHAEIANAKMETLKAREDAEDAREEAKAARAEVFDASPMPTPITPGGGLSSWAGSVRFPVTPTPRPTLERSNSGSPVVEEPKEVDSGSGIWGFWNKRTTSTAKVPGLRSLSHGAG